MWKKDKPQTPESNLKRSKAMRGRKNSSQHCANISKGRIGIIFSEEHKNNIRKATLETYASGQRKKVFGSENPIRRGPFHTIPHTEETKRKMSISQRNLPEEVRKNKSKKISESNKMRPVSSYANCIAAMRKVSWKGGISKLPYPFEFDNPLKERIKKRDNYTCQLCSCTEKQKLRIHHIDYDKKNLDDNNLITLCTICNSKVNFNRLDWQQSFQNSIRNKVYAIA